MPVQVTGFHPGIWIDIEIASKEFGVPLNPEQRAEILNAVVATFRHTVQGVTLSVNGVTARVVVPIGTTIESLLQLRTKCQNAIAHIYCDTTDTSG